MRGKGLFGKYFLFGFLKLGEAGDGFAVHGDLFHEHRQGADPEGHLAVEGAVDDK